MPEQRFCVSIPGPLPKEFLPKEVTGFLDSLESYIQFEVTKIEDTGYISWRADLLVMEKERPRMFSGGGKTLEALVSSLKETITLNFYKAKDECREGEGHEPASK